MAANAFLLIAVYVLLLMVLAQPLGRGLARFVADKPLFAGLERPLWRLLGTEQPGMRWPHYLLAILLFNALGLLLLLAILLLQGELPLNPQQLPSLSWHLALNTAVSFVTNTNWQSYGGESTLSYFSQMVGLTVQNFLSAATGIAVAFALIRGFASRSLETLGNAWRDLTRITLYILLPISLLMALFFVSQGSIQNFLPYHSITTLEGHSKRWRWGRWHRRKRSKCSALTAVASLTLTPLIPLKTPTH